jgi:hypothetical protein
MFGTPFMKQAIRSNWPSQMTAAPASRMARLDLSRPKKILLLVKMSVSGELTYLAVFFVAGQDAAAEADNAALFVADGKHQAAAEAVIIVNGRWPPERRWRIIAGGRQGMGVAVHRRDILFPER